MITLDYDFADDFFQYKVVPTYWNDAINVITSDFQNRIGFKFLADFYLENTYVGTLKNQPFNGFGQIQLNSFTKNLLSYDANWKSSSANYNPNSFKNCTICYGEEFSRKIRFKSIESETISTCTSSNAIQLNFDEPSMLVGNDRVYITKDLPTVNPQYNGFGKVFVVGSTYAVITKAYSYTPYVETGYIWEGVEFFDYHIANSGADVAIQTTNAHNFSVGDQVYLQMDGDARSSIVFTASVGNQCSYVRLYSPTYSTYQDISITPVTYSTTFEQFLSDLAIQINCEQPPVGGFSAWYFGTGNVMYLTSPFGSGSTYNNYIPVISMSGGGYTASVMSNLEGYDSNNQGLNPQLSDTYTVKEVLNSTEFTLNKIPSVYYNNMAGSERGTVYSMNNFKLKSILCGETFSLAHASFTKYDPFMFSANSENFTELSFPGLALDGIYGSVSTLGETDKIKLNSRSNLFTVDIWNHNVIPPYGPRIDYCILETYNSSNALIQSFTISNFYINDEEKLTLGWGPFNLNLLRSLSSVDFNPIPVGYPINATVSSYKISAYDTNGDQLTHTYSFEFECAQNPMQITWLNNLGGWEYMSIDSVSLKETISTDRNNFLRVGNYIGYKDGTWGNSVYENAAITYDATKRGTTTFNMLSDSTYQITTPFLKISKNEDKWIEDLFQSPEVYAIFEGVDPNTPGYNPEDLIQQPNVVPITILDSELIKPQEKSKIVYYRISFKMSQYKNGPHKIIGN